MLQLIIFGTAIGVGATLAMDVWAIVLNRVAGLPLPNWANVGRWFWHLGRGRVFHDDISNATPHPRELSIGWGAHYGVGVIYGIAFLFIMGANWMNTPTFPAAWIFSIVMVGAGWFLLQPGMGLGWAASRTPNPWKVRGLNLVAHTIFALGLWGTALLIT